MPPGHRRRRHAHRVRGRPRAQAAAARPRAGRALLSAGGELAAGPVWYAGYGSNLDPDRFGCYLRGGRPAGATRTYPGAREPGPPLDTRPVTLPGSLVFAWESPTWGGGIAFHDPDTAGETLAAAYLLTPRQLADVLEQEMWREPGADHDLATVVAERRHAVGPGRYETLHLTGELDGRPVLTFSAPDVPALGLRPPAPPYVATIARGLRRTHGLDDAAVVEYLLACPGVTPAWTRAGLGQAVAGNREEQPRPRA